MASTSISSKSVPLYSIFLRGTASICDDNSSMPLRPWVSTTPITTSSPRLRRRSASLSMLKVLPTPGAYPRNSLKVPRVFSGGEATSSHSSGFLRKIIFSEANCCGALEYADAATAGGPDRRYRCVSRDHRGHFVFLQACSSREPDHRGALVSAGNSSSFSGVGDGGFGVHVARGDDGLQLFFSPADGRVYHCGSAKLGRAVRVSGYIHYG